MHLAVVFSFFLMFFKTFEMSVIKHVYYKNRATDNQVYESVILAPRGSIYDRKGRVLAESLYHYFKDIDGKVVYEGTDIYSGLKFEEQGVSYELRRKYPYGNALAFVSGYVAKPKEEEIANAGCKKHLDKRSLVGRSGIESWFDCFLRGEDGNRLVEVDAKGKFVRDLGREEPKPGASLVLSIDAFWQKKAYDLLAGRKGALIASDPKTGKILAFVSSPAYDPNDFSYQADQQKIMDYLQDEYYLPLLNRVSSAKFHPGSVFKMVVATAGLEEKTVTANTAFADTGSIKVGEYEYRNWLWTKRGQVDGQVDMYKGLQRSNDVYFYKLGETLGPDKIKKWAQIYGYNAKTGIEIGGETEGLIPDPAWKEKVKKEKWFLGNTYHMSIGQGDVDVSPLQVQVATTAIANDGTWCRPSLVADNNPDCKKMPVSYDTIKVLQEGMSRACATGGTAWPLFNFKTKIACKTGTAQVGDGSPDLHAWLTAFAPIVDPQIAITVMMERAGEGSDEAAPIVGDFLKAWFEETDTVVPRKTDVKVVGE